MIQELDFKDVPSWFPLCQNAQCPMAETCLRQMAARVAPETLTIRECVMPSQWKGETCKWYAEARTTVVARGFTHLFDHVFNPEATAMRKELLEYFGYKKKYYACLKGEMPLTPEEQQYIRRMVARRGYDWEVTFDREEEQIDFPYKHP